MHAPDDAPRPPVSDGEPLAGWTAAGVLEVRGDVTVVRARGELPARVAVFRYRGAQPLPRFLEDLRADGERWRAAQHPNLVPTLETGRLPSQITCYWAQRDAPGTLLSARLQSQPLFSPAHALGIARQLGGALAAVHRAGLVHGEIAPHDVYLADDREQPLLAWGGLATRLEAAGMDAGRSGPRLAEAAPEQLAGRSFGTPADVYGLCALLFRMLAGEPAWTVRRGGPPPGVTAGDPLPALPEWVASDLVAALADGLQRDPARRPALSELLARLEEPEIVARRKPAPPGTWAPAASTLLPATAFTPPPASRTIAPGGAGVLSFDPALANTPVSVSRHGDARPAAGPGRVPARSGPPRGSLLPAVLLAAVIVGAVGVVALWWTRAPDPPPVEPAPAPEAAQPPAPLPAPAILSLVTEPPSAEVWEEGRFLGLTPIEVVFDPAAGTRERVFELRLAGHRTQVVRQPFSTVDVRHTAALQPVPRPSPSPSPPAPPVGGIKVER